MRILILAALIFSVSCSNEREKKTFEPKDPQKIQDFSYSDNAKIFRYQQEIVPMYPKYSGGTDSSGEVVFSIEPQLPLGLQFSTKTGRIAGTPEALSVTPIKYTVKISNDINSVEFSMYFSVLHQQPSGLNYGTSLLDTVVGGVINVTPECDDGIRFGAKCTSFSITPTLPQGLNFDSSTGRIVGQVSQRFNQSFVITAQNTGGSVSFELQIDVRSLIQKISLGSKNACVNVNGEFYCWGDNSSGQFGRGDLISSSVPLKTMSFGFTDLVLGVNQSCGYSPSGVYCWGDNSEDVFPSLLTGSYLIPQKIDKTLTGISLSSGLYSRSCFVEQYYQNNEDQPIIEAFCLGNFSQGRLLSNNYRVEMLGQPIQGMFNSYSGDDFSCFVSNNYLYCLGDNSKGQLGDDQDSGSFSLEAVQVKGLPSVLSSFVRQIKVYGDSACILFTSGQVYCWGEINGQIRPTLMNITIPQESYVDITGIHLGRDSFCVENMSRVYCRGNNDKGQLGTGSVNSYETDFMSVKFLDNSDLVNFSEFTIGEDFGCAIVSNQVYCWGSNSHGKIGQPPTILNSNKAMKVNLD